MTGTLIKLTSLSCTGVLCKLILHETILHAATCLQAA